MHLNAARVRLLDQIAKRIERPTAARIGLADAGDFSRRLGRIEIPRVGAAPDLDEDRIGVALRHDFDHPVDLRVRAEGRAEAVHPVGAILGKCRSGFSPTRRAKARPTCNCDRDRKEQSPHPIHVIVKAWRRNAR